MPLPVPRTVVVITLDCVRPDFLGCYGCARVRTPTLDRMAARGVLCGQAFSQAPNTWVSHAGILTGLYPVGHGLRSPYDRLDPGTATLASALRGLGFRSAAFPGNDLVGSRMGYGKGFDLFFEAYVPAAETAEEHDRPHANNRNRWEDVLAAADAWLGGQRDPAFLWFHYLDTHHLPACDLPDYFRFSQDPLWQFYEGKVSYADERCVRAILEMLSRHGRYADALLVVLADHGEELLPGRPPVHNGELREGVLRVPMILFGEGMPWKGVRIDSLVRTVDLVPTLLALVDPGASAEAVAVGGLDGARLPLPGLEAQGRAPRDGDVAYAENEPLGLACLRTPEWKFVKGEREEALYHILSDPLERHDTLGRNPGTALHLREQLGQLRARRATADRTEAEREEEETRRLLRAFGYVE